ncbi:MAG: amidoligase family protein [Victivallales bacterium]
MNMKELQFGLEVETLCDRVKAAKAVQSVVGGNIEHEGGTYDCYSVTDLRGRKWKIVRDSSLSNVPASRQAEVVSPILHYEDIPQFQEVIRALRNAKARVDGTCGIHCHVSAEHFNGRQLANLAKIFYKQEELIIHAFGVSHHRLQNYTRPLSDDFIREIETKKPQTKDELNTIWYGYHNTNPQHYDHSRYRTVNFHNVWYRGTVEFRFLEGSLHSGKIRAGLSLCLALAAKAINSKCASSKKRAYDPASAKYDFRVFLISSLKLNGDEFKNVRKHLLANMPGDSAWKHGRPQRAEA